MPVSEMSLGNSLKESRKKNDFYLLIYCFISFYRGKNWRPERLSKLPEITQLARAELAFRSRSVLSYILCSFLNTTVVSGRSSQVGLGVSLFYTHTAHLSVSTPVETQFANQEGPFCYSSLCEHRSHHRHLPSSSNIPSQHPVRLLSFSWHPGVRL